MVSQTIEALVAAGVHEMFVFCGGGAAGKRISHHVMTSQWCATSYAIARQIAAAVHPHCNDCAILRTDLRSLAGLWLVSAVPTGDGNCARSTCTVLRATSQSETVYGESPLPSPWLCGWQPALLQRGNDEQPMKFNLSIP